MYEDIIVDFLAKLIWRIDVKIKLYFRTTYPINIQQKDKRNPVTIHFKYVWHIPCPLYQVIVGIGYPSA